jgi:hypothetical protein
MACQNNRDALVEDFFKEFEIYLYLLLLVFPDMSPSTDTETRKRWHSAFSFSFFSLESLISRSLLTLEMIALLESAVPLFGKKK